MVLRARADLHISARKARAVGDINSHRETGGRCRSEFMLEVLGRLEA